MGFERIFGKELICHSAIQLFSRVAAPVVPCVVSVPVKKIPPSILTV